MMDKYLRRPRQGVDHSVATIRRTRGRRPDSDVRGWAAAVGVRATVIIIEHHANSHVSEGCVKSRSNSSHIKAGHALLEGTALATHCLRDRAQVETVGGLTGRWLWVHENASHVASACWVTSNLARKLCAAVAQLAQGEYTLIS